MKPKAKAKPKKKKVNLKKANLKLMEEVLTLRREALAFVQEKVALEKELKRLQLLEQEQLTVIFYLRSNVLGLNERLRETK